MKTDQENTCQCSDETPVILNGSQQESPLNCMRCKKPVSLIESTSNDELAEAISKWGQLYRSLFTLWQGSIEYKQWAKEKLLDEIGSINLDGLKLAQQYNEKRKTYYWLFQDYSDKDYVEPEHCPFCGAAMEPIMENKFKVCSDCKTAYPDKQTS